MRFVIQSLLLPLMLLLHGAEASTSASLARGGFGDADHIGRVVGSCAGSAITALAGMACCGWLSG